jgi:hypothetical protein
MTHKQTPVMQSQALQAEKFGYCLLSQARNSHFGDSRFTYSIKMTATPATAYAACPISLQMASRAAAAWSWSRAGSTPGESRRSKLAPIRNHLDNNATFLKHRLMQSSLGLLEFQSRAGSTPGESRRSRFARIRNHLKRKWDISTPTTIRITWKGNNEGDIVAASWETSGVIKSFRLSPVRSHLVVRTWSGRERTHAVSCYAFLFQER